MNKPVTVLLVEDSEDDAKLALRALRRGGFDPTYRRMQTAAELETALAEERWDAVIADFKMPGFTGMDALRIFRSTGLDIPFILVSGTIGEETAVDAMKAGASDYVMKKNLERLAPALERELKETQMRAAHRMAQAALTDSEKRFRQMAENIRDVFFLFDADGTRMLYISPAYEEISGRSCASLYAKPESWTEAIHPDDQASAYEKYKKGMSAGNAEFEFRIVRPDGSIRWIKLRGFPVRDDAGNLVRITGVAEDITDRIQAEEQTHRLAEQLTTTLESITDAFFTVDRQWRFTFLNREAERLLGRTRAELTGRDLWTEFPDAIGSTFDREYRRAMADNKTVSFEEFYPPLNTWLSVRAYPSEQGLAVYFHDITERKRAEQALARLVAIIEATPDMVATSDPNGHVHYYNRAGLRMLGFEPGLDLSTVRILDTHPDWAAKLVMEEGIPHAIEHGTWSGETALLRRDGREIPISQVIIAHKGSDGSVDYLSTIARDITLQKEHEKHILRLNRVYAVLSGINTLIVRVRDPDELFREACRIAVEEGNFGMAWIGMFDPATQDVTPVAWAGESAEEVTRAKSSARDDSPRGKGAVGQSIRERRPVFNNDIIAHNFGGPRLQIILKLGFRSQVTLPLYEDQTVVGTLTMYAREPNFFDEEELRLLTELAGDISFALENISRQQKLDKLARIRAVSSEINAAIVRIRERKALLEETCRIASEHGKFEMIWIGAIDHDTQQVQPIAWTGFSEETARAVNWDNISTSKGTLGEAIQTRKPSVRNDIEAELPGGKLRQEALQKGCHSTVSLPLVVDDNVVALILLGAPGVGFFDEEELALLNEVAGNISFALEHIEKEEKIARLSRIQAVMGSINALIVRVRDRNELFGEACRIAVEHGQFKMAWIGVVDRSAMKIVPIASAGAGPEFLTLIKDRFSLREDSPLGNTMSARAVREKKAIVTNEIRGDTRIFFEKELSERGILSMAILPLLVSDDAVGVLALYADETGSFDEVEMKLLTELAGDIAFAIDHIGKQARLDYLAYYDVLTGLANRGLFLERVAQHMRSAVSGGHKLALFLIDLERFKNINDSLGRPAGDALLKQMAEWLTHSAGDANLLARIDADHFAMVMPEVSQDNDLARLVEKTLAAFLEHPFRLNDAVFRIAVKVGIALFPDDGADAETLFRNAEAALKKAKSGGERYLFHTQKMTEAVAGKLALENQLRQALDNGEFVLHYQPKVNLVSGKLTSAEALIRWNDPRTGLVPPGRFIPILEEIGLIYEVGRWALRQAIEDYLRWRAADLPAVRIAVNVSPLQLRNRGFIAEIEQVIGIDAHAPAGLELEITESLIMEDVKHNIASLKAIRAMGVTIAIDDFGTGFSSLNYLSKLPVDTLKIDRSFVIDMTAGPEGLALVSTIINLAHSLKLKVVAEGVETEEQSRLLRLLSCDEMQGFLFSKPVPGEIFETRFLAPPPAG